MVKKTPQKHQEEIARLTSRVEELEADYRRVLADYQNQNRRHQEAESALIRMASASLIEKILVSLDSLELAQSHLKDTGLQMVVDKLYATLTEEGLTPVITKDQKFDPLIMDCVEVVPGEKDTVISTTSKGFYLHGKVIRPAKVTVGSGDLPKK